MKSKGWMVSTVLVVGSVLALRGCLSKRAPDENLAGHFEAMCEIARDHTSSPVRGVRALGGYFGEHTEAMLGAFGATLATIERIADDRDHDARAEKARERIRAPFAACEEDWLHFFEAVDANPEAAALLDRGLDRLGRTLEILFGEALRLDRKSLPLLGKQLAARVPLRSHR